MCFHFHVRSPCGIDFRLRYCEALGALACTIATMSETSSTRTMVLGAAAVAAGANFLHAAALPPYVRPVASAKILSGRVAALGRKMKGGIHASHRCDAKLLCRGGCAWRWHAACSRRCTQSLFMLHRAMAEQTAIPDPRTARIRAFHHGITFDHIRTHAIIHNRVHPFVQSERSVPVLALENPLQNNDYGPIHFICV